MSIPTPAASDARLRAIARGKEEDRHWFAFNPGRNYRVRAALPDEAPPLDGMLPFILLKQVRPGARLRVCIYADQPPPGAVPELWAEQAWEAAMSRDPKTARRFAEAEAEILAGEAPHG